jgi:catechol 2,3-dioxygenase-like lactoylglutathione lyase family enzyme
VCFTSQSRILHACAPDDLTRRSRRKLDRPKPSLLQGPAGAARLDGSERDPGGAGRGDLVHVGTRPHRYAVGIHHLCFAAPSRTVVDERARWLDAQAVPIESGPADYPYSPGYYAVFFYDPDGMKLEIVHRPPRQ